MSFGVRIVGTPSVHVVEDAANRWYVCFGMRGTPASNGACSVTISSQRSAIVEMVSARVPAGRLVVSNGVASASWPAGMQMTSSVGAPLEVFSMVSLWLRSEGGVVPPTGVIVPWVVDRFGKRELKVDFHPDGGASEAGLCSVTLVGSFT